jgi:hypothetical protein
MLAEIRHELLWGYLKCLTNTEEREHCERPACLNHLPMAHTEVESIHVFLAELARQAQGSDPVAQSAKESGVSGGEIPTGSHPPRVPVHEQKEHEHRYVF